MFNTQARDLCQLGLSRFDDNILHVAFEPFEIKTKKLMALKEGNLFFVAKDMPKIYILDKDKIVGQAVLGLYEKRESILVKATEHMNIKRKKENSLSQVWAKFCTLKRSDFEVGAIVPIEFGGHKNIVLYQDGSNIASASMVHGDDGYALQINRVNSVQ